MKYIKSKLSFLNDISKENRIYLGIIVFFVLFFMILIKYIDRTDKKELQEHGVYTDAIIYRFSSNKYGEEAYFYYYLADGTKVKKSTGTLSDCCNLGDTVRIKYSSINPKSVVKPCQCCDGVVNWCELV